MIIGSDTVFIMNRAYAELVVSRFDSLKVFKSGFKGCISILDSCQISVNKSKELIKLQSDQILSLNNTIKSYEDLRESYNRTENINKQIRQQLKSEIRKRKTYKLLFIGTLTASFGALAYFILR